MAVALKQPCQSFGVCNHLVSSRCFHASANTFRNFAAREKKKRKASVGWSDIGDTCTTQSKARERRSPSLQKPSDAIKSKIRERRSALSKKSSDTSKNIKVQERSSVVPKKSSEGGGKAEAKTVPGREALKRRRAPEQVVWSLHTAETMLLYKDGMRNYSVLGI